MMSLFTFCVNFRDNMDPHPIIGIVRHYGQVRRFDLTLYNYNSI
jgi:hypothetical protein